MDEPHEPGLKWLQYTCLNNTSFKREKLKKTAYIKFCTHTSPLYLGVSMYCLRDLFSLTKLTSIFYAEVCGQNLKQSVQ